MEMKKTGGRPTLKATSAVFALMADGNSRRIADVAFALNIPRERAYEAIRSLCRQRAIHAFGDKRSRNENRRYALTEKGRMRADPNVTLEVARYQPPTNRALETFWSVA